MFPSAASFLHLFNGILRVFNVAPAPPQHDAVIIYDMARMPRLRLDAGAPEAYDTYDVEGGF